MVTKEHKTNTPADFLRLFPEDCISAPAARTYRKVLGRLDQLLFLEEFGELSVDREAFIALTWERSLIPAEIADIMMLETTKHLGRRLKIRKNGVQVSWIDSAKYGLPIVPLSPAIFRELTGGRFTTEKDVEKFIYRVLPDVPKFWTRSNSQAIRTDERGVAKSHILGLPRCASRLLGCSCSDWLAHRILCPSCVSWQVALAWAIVYSGFATAYVFLQCAVKPDWN